jgi:hypothetical protein
MKKDILSWNDVKEMYLEFHKMDSFTENMAIDVDFGYWLVNNCIIPGVSQQRELLLASSKLHIDIESRDAIVDRFLKATYGAT